jgi:uncharacterized protein (DUF1330 family)
MTREVIDGRRMRIHDGPMRSGRRIAIQEPVMTTFAVARLYDVEFGPAIIEYLGRIDDTLEPFGGRFVLHGGPVEKIEGDWTGDLVAIAFPDRAAARAWYASEPYQAILPLRIDHSHGDVIFIDAVSDGHRATDILGELAA